MNGLMIVYLVGAVAIGFLIGAVVELMIDATTVRELQDENRKLKLELRQARKSPEVIEIVDNRKTDEVKFGGF